MTDPPPTPSAVTDLEVAGQLDAALFEYRRILALPPDARDSAAVRRAALAVARELAAVARSLERHRALDALRALEYGFVALAQDPVDAPTVLGSGELDAVLLRGDVGRWMHEALHD